MKAGRKKFGELLVDAKVIDELQLAYALSLQKETRQRLGQVLIDLGYAAEQQIVEALSIQLSLHVFRGEKIQANDALKDLIPKDLALKKGVLPVCVEDRKLYLAMTNPLDFQTINEISFMTGRTSVVPLVAGESALLESIDKFYGSAENVMDVLQELQDTDYIEYVQEAPEDEKDSRELFSGSDDPPIVKLVTRILSSAIRSRASDIHIEPREKDVRVRYRVDGSLREALTFPTQIKNHVISRIKILANLNITKKRTPQDGSACLKVEGSSIDLRVSVLPSIHGEKIVIRVLSRDMGSKRLEDLGLPEYAHGSLMRLLSQPQGMLLVTGPTGSGKTTTLYSILNRIRSDSENIVTIEDPVEYKIENLTQVMVNESVGLTFANALRSILRQDPDIIMVGEIRDLETAEIAVRSALTGHLVLSTLHTNDTVSTIARLTDMGLPPYFISSALSGVLAQRLLRKICENCKTTAEPAAGAGKGLFEGIKQFYRGEGCPVCYNTGYYGQIGVYEYLEIGPAMKMLISESRHEDAMFETARHGGLKTLMDGAVSKVAEGITTPQEVLSKIPLPRTGSQSHFTSL